MLKEIVGIRRYEFTDQRTKDIVSGYNLYLQWEEPEVAGVACEAVSVSMKKLEEYDPALGDKVRIGYNKYGKCDFIIPVA